MCNCVLFHHFITGKSSLWSMKLSLSLFCTMSSRHWYLFEFPLNSGSQHPALCLSLSQSSVFQSICILFSLSTFVTVFVLDSVFVKKIPLPSFPWTSDQNILPVWQTLAFPGPLFGKSLDKLQIANCEEKNRNKQRWYLLLPSLPDDLAWLTAFVEDNA